MANERSRGLALFGLGITGVLAGGVVGGVTNAINGRISPAYFKVVLGWRFEDIDVLWRACIAQGIFEGLLLGMCFSLVFTTGVGIITRAACRFSLGVRYLGVIILGALVGWLLGGAVDVGLASLSPEFYRRTFFGVPDEFVPMLKYAWVGGSIWGVKLGGLVSMIVGLVLLRAHWLRTKGLSLEK